MHTDIHTYIHAYTHTHRPTYMDACMHTNIYAYTNVIVYMHTYAYFHIALHMHTQAYICLHRGFVLVRGGFYLEGFLWVVFVRSPSIKVHVGLHSLQQKVKHHFQFQVL